MRSTSHRVLVRETLRAMNSLITACTVSGSRSLAASGPAGSMPRSRSARAISASALAAANPPQAEAEGGAEEDEDDSEETS